MNPYTSSSSGELFSRRQLTALIWPLITEQLLTVLVGMADVLMISFAGKEAISGVSLVDSMNYLVIQVLYAMTAGGTVVCARYIGEGRPEKAGRSGAQLILITLTGALCITAGFFIGNRHILSFLFGRVETSVIDNASLYLQITCLSFPFLALYNSGAAVFRAAGNTKIAVQVSLYMNLINVSGNALCILLLHMGVMGVAIPTLISRIFAAVWMLHRLQQKDHALRVPSLSSLRPQTPVIKAILSIGLPNGAESCFFQLGKLLIQSLVSTLGTASIAAFAVACNLATWLYLPGNALGAAMITIVAQCCGAGERKQARNYARRLLRLNYIILFFLCIFMIAFRGFLVSCYHLSGESAALAEGLIFIHSVAMVIWPLGFLFPYYFRASGRPAFTMAVAIFAMWTFRIGLAWVYIRLLHMNVLGVWYAMFADWIFRAAVYILAFRREAGTLK